ncbi:MAG: DUF1674 domain-containing protein [Pseudomonadota bacterium]
MSDEKPTEENNINPLKEDQIQKKREKADKKSENMPEEYGGTEGPEPTRYDDWENGGRCTDF